MIQNSELIEWLKKKAETVTMPGARKMYQAAVRALEAQKDMVSRQDVSAAMSCSEIPNSSDCISRQAAIEVVQNRHMMLSKEKTLLIDDIEKLPPAEPEIVRCRDCKHFEYDHVETVSGIPLIVAHEICMRWGDGVKTSENGYCFLAERKEVADGNHN